MISDNLTHHNSFVWIISGVCFFLYRFTRCYFFFKLICLNFSISVSLYFTCRELLVFHCSHVGFSDWIPHMWAVSLRYAFVRLCFCCCRSMSLRLFLSPNVFFLYEWLFCFVCLYLIWLLLLLFHFKFPFIGLVK